jgi:hypothetical protein
MSQADRPSGARDDASHCPFCGSADVELLSLFGSQLLTEQAYCRTCRTPFERVKDSSADAGRTPPPAGRPGDAG